MYQDCRANQILKETPDSVLITEWLPDRLPGDSEVLLGMAGLSSFILLHMQKWSMEYCQNFIEPNWKAYAVSTNAADNWVFNSATAEAAAHLTSLYLSAASREPLANHNPKSILLQFPSLWCPKACPHVNTATGTNDLLIIAPTSCLHSVRFEHSLLRFLWPRLQNQRPKGLHRQDRPC